MTGVKSGSQGSWTLVAIKNNKVIGQDVGIKIRDLIPARFSEFKKRYHKSSYRIEDNTGKIVYSE